ncbi:hypothetical protein ABT304_25300 [Nocardioides sp. NPDC000445]|uniref:hypothetical protein n=1 Tax=Nocardioides sp. NPDC000445 TaxID=3154257 RepID=UPI00332CCF6C
MATAVDQIVSFIPIALPIAALVGLVFVAWLIWHLWHEVEAMDRARMVCLVAGVIFLILYLGLDTLDKFGISLPPPP